MEVRPGCLQRLIALLLAVCAAPLLLPFIVGIQAASRGPVFVRQARVGWNQRTIQVWKLRTMEVDAEQQLRDLLVRDSELCREFARYGRLARDPRIVRPFGRWARRYSLDELPQLMNVVAGSMVLVGPRPIPRAQVEELDTASVALRASVPPGLTGLWQVHGRSDTTLRQMIRFDVLYVRRRSIMLDLYILLRTPLAIVTGRGAY